MALIITSIFLLITLTLFLIEEPIVLLIGIVTSYNSKVNQQGSFECNVEIVSENTTLLDFEIDDDNKLNEIFDSLEDSTKH